MRRDRAFLAFVALMAVPSAVAVSCGGGTNNTSSSGTSSSSGSGGSAPDGGTGGTGGTIIITDAGGGCKTSADCDGGVCVNNVCCATAADYCNGVCCAGGSVCLFDKCVVPGSDCFTANDCDPGQYCETALGSGNGDGGVGDGGVGDGGDGGLCTQPLPLGGKCLDLPPICDPDAGVPGPDAGCVASCEYHPPPGQLNAVARWQWGPTAQFKPNFTDVWSTPAVGRVFDGNCDGVVNELDAPNVIFVSGRAINVNTGLGTCCHCTGAANSACLTGVLRVLDGRTGQEIWSLDKANMGSIGFAGLSPAIGDVDGDGRMDILAVTGEGFVVMLDSNGNVLRTSDLPIPGHGNATFGWGGGLSIADMDGDGFPEIAYGPTVYTTTNNTITLKFTGANGVGGGNIYLALSALVDLDGAPDNHLELLAGRTAYRADGTILWDKPAIPDGFPAVGDLNLDGSPEVVIIGAGQALILDGATGNTLLGPLTLPGTGAGGPPTIADFDGDGRPEIGVAQQNIYSMLKPDFANNTIQIVWQTPNHDLSSSVTGSSVFDFEGDGIAEVIYADECFLWVFDGQTGAVRFAASHTSFTATEASLVADVDGDGRAEMIMVSNGADPSSAGWNCLNAANQPVTVNGVTWTPSPAADKAYRGMVLFGDAASSWVGTRTLWNQHTYHVSNICDNRDSACVAPNTYGSIPKVEQKNWTLPWLNNFRQNVQDKGLFDAPDATISLTVDCTAPALLHAFVRNIGLASLPPGAEVGFYKKTPNGDVQVGLLATTHTLFPGQTEELIVSVDPAVGNNKDQYVARVLIDPVNPKFHECREDNNESAVVTANCIQ